MQSNFNIVSFPFYQTIAAINEIGDILQVKYLAK